MIDHFRIGQKSLNFAVTDYPISIFSADGGEDLDIKSAAS